MKNNIFEKILEYTLSDKIIKEKTSSTHLFMKFNFFYHKFNYICFSFIWDESFDKIKENKFFKTFSKNNFVLFEKWTDNKNCAFFLINNNTPPEEQIILENKILSLKETINYETLNSFLKTFQFVNLKISEITNLISEVVTSYILKSNDFDFAIVENETQPDLLIDDKNENQQNGKSSYSDIKSSISQENNFYLKILQTKKLSSIVYCSLSYKEDGIEIASKAFTKIDYFINNLDKTNFEKLLNKFGVKLFLLSNFLVDTINTYLQILPIELFSEIIHDAELMMDKYKSVKDLHIKISANNYSNIEKVFLFSCMNQ